jgi:hypothetical protein
LPDSEGRIWVKYHRDHKWTRWAVNKGLVSFETDRMLVTFEEGWVYQPVKPKEVVRKDPLILRVNTGFWKYGWVTLTFDCKEDADKVELELRKMLPP